MYLIAVYDIAAPRRLAKMLKLCREYLHHVQFSVFEGELTNAQLAELKFKASVIMNEEEDSFIIYNIGSEKWLKREIIGINKNNSSNFV